MQLHLLHPAQPSCRLCDLGAGCRSPGIPTRLVSVTPPAEVGAVREALMLVGQNPGHQEDVQGECFVGPPGDIINRVYLGASGLLSPTRHIYLTNTARCATPHADPTNTHYRTCSSTYLLQDIATLRRSYDRVHVLCLGAPATRHVHARLGGPNMSLTDAFTKGPLTYTLEPGEITVSSTFHPAYLLRDSNKIHAVARHLSQLLDFLTARLPASTPLRIVTPGPPPRRPRPCDSTSPGALSATAPPSAPRT